MVGFGSAGPIPASGLLQAQDLFAALLQQVTGLRASFWECPLASRQHPWLLQRGYCMLDSRRSHLHHPHHCSCHHRDRNQMNAQADGTELMPVHWAEMRMTAPWAMYFFFVQQVCLGVWRKVA
jgi:hypothetical protein